MHFLYECAPPNKRLKLSVRAGVTQMARCFLSSLLAVLVLHVASCAANSHETQYVAPSDQSITAETEASYDGIHQRIYVTNHSTVTVVITSFQLRDCENIANPCELTRLRIPLSPGQRTLLATIGPANRDRPFNFHYGWTWEVSSPTH